MQQLGWGAIKVAVDCHPELFLRRISFSDARDASQEQLSMTRQATLTAPCNLALATCDLRLGLIQSRAMQETLQAIYQRLYAHFGPQHWWPGDGPFQVIVGAILTQNTAWTNVETAMANLSRAELLDPERLYRAREARIAALIRPSGYFNLKAKKLKAFVRFLFEKHQGRLSHLFKREPESLREELLAVYGIGPETADSIILYAANQPIFVIDAYTRRIAARLGLSREAVTYDELQRLFMANLPRDTPLFNEYHALLVMLGKQYCRKSAPRCGECPLQEICPAGIPKIINRKS